MGLKRAFDVILAVAALCLLSPLLAVLGLLVRMRLGSPVLFSQQRPGLHGRPFELIKFRTMTKATGADGELKPDAERLTRFGRMLRSTSLDELPELLNVIKGDMSLVGPRPLLMQYLDRYTPRQARRHDVRPGITGWAQVNGRNRLSWEDKFTLDVWYTEHQSLGLDLKILRMTFWKALRREGVAQEGHATAEEFRAAHMKDRLANWTYPEIEEGKPTKYNWVVQHKDRLRLGYGTDIGAFTYINAKNGVVIEDFVQIGSHCSLYSVSTIDGKEGAVILKRNCKIGTHSVVMPGVTIGENSVIGAFSFVNRDIPANVIAMGVPARITGDIEPAGKEEP